MRDYWPEIVGLIAAFAVVGGFMLLVKVLCGP